MPCTYHADNPLRNKLIYTLKSRTQYIVGSRRVQVHRGSALGRLLKVLRPSDESLGHGSLQARTGSIVVDIDAQGATTARRADILLHTSHSRPGQGGPAAAAEHGAAHAGSHVCSPPGGG